ncbi:DUF1266 domain-containing protein [Flavobacterium adhaerens]|uniref:DUF1266 domain-containing protein n=1 Tax=Flavobacterium adhaerens TaxID=3149043 RepID=UPI0032B553DC
MSTTTKYHKFENPTNLTQSQLWLIATSAMLTEMNKEFHDTLLPHHIYGTPELLAESKQSLLRDWETKDFPDLKGTIDYLYSKNTFGATLNAWEFLTESEFDKVQQVGIKEKGLRNELDMVRNYQFDLENSDLGWHYGRCSWIIRHGFYNGFMTEEEAWSLLETNGKLIKKSFDSWESFGLSYLVGSQYWKLNNYNEATMKLTKKNIMYLLTNSNSPWLNIDWNDFE